MSCAMDGTPVEYTQYRLHQIPKAESGGMSIGPETSAKSLSAAVYRRPCAKRYWSDRETSAVPRLGGACHHGQCEVLDSVVVAAQSGVFMSSIRTHPALEIRPGLMLMRAWAAQAEGSS